MTVITTMLPVGWCEDDAHFLSIARFAFQCIFRIRTRSGIALAFIDATVQEDLPYFRFVDMAAAHAAAGMFGENQFLCATVECLRAIGLIAGRPGWIPATRIPVFIVVCAVHRVAPVSFSLFLLLNGDS